MVRPHSVLHLLHLMRFLQFDSVLRRDQNAGLRRLDHPSAAAVGAADGADRPSARHRRLVMRQALSIARARVTKSEPVWERAALRVTPSRASRVAAGARLGWEKKRSRRAAAAPAMPTRP